MEQILHVPPDNIEKHINALSRIGNLGDSLYDGFTRESYSDEETAAMKYLSNQARAAGFVSRWDPVGNLFMRFPGESDKIIQIGSHLDTVPEGGNFDGATGIVAGLEALKLVSNYPLDYGVELVIWRGEESATYDTAYKGSSGAFGIPLPKGSLKRTFDGQTLEEAVRSQGYDPSYFERNEATLPQTDIDRILAHFELHIEQGNQLEKEETDIGIVTSVRGHERFSVKLEGRDYHDGYLAKILVALDRLANDALRQGMDLVQTVGVINTNNAPENHFLKKCSMTKVSEYAEVSLNTPYRLPDNIVDWISCRLNVVVHQEEGEQLRVRLLGEFDHSGATPMGPKYRRDANLAVAYLVSKAMDLETSLRARINYPGNQGHFLLDIRSAEKENRDSYVEKVIETIKGLSTEYRLKYQIEKISSSSPIQSLNEPLQELVAEASKNLGYSYLYMPSGAGHDAAVVANQRYSNGNIIPVSIIFIPCRQGKSHCKEEYASITDITKGANVLANSVLRLVRF